MMSNKKKRVMWRLPKRNPFYKLGFNPNHIPDESKYSEKRKTPLPHWQKPTYNWPPRIPRPTMHRGKTLLAHIDSEYRQ